MTESTLVPSIVVLKSGEKLITQLQEVFGNDEDGEEGKKGICLLMNYPYALELIKVPTPEASEMDLQVKFSKWCPYSIDNSFRVPYDGVLPIGEADPGLAQAYQAKVDEQKARSSEETEPEVPAPPAPPTNLDLPTEGSVNADAQRADIEAAIKGLDATAPTDASVGA